MTESKIDLATAENEFDRFCDEWDIDSNIDDLDQEERTDFLKFKRQIVRKIMSGNLIYNDDQTFNYEMIYPPDGVTDNLKIVRTKGGSYLNMDSYKESQTMHKGLSKIAAMINKPLPFIAKLDDVDLKILQAIQTLFLAS